MALSIEHLNFRLKVIEGKGGIEIQNPDTHGYRGYYRDLKLWYLFTYNI